MDATAAQIAAAGFPFPLLLAWIAAFFEIALAIALPDRTSISREAAVVAAAYVLFLGFLVPRAGPMANNPMEFGFFVDHFTFIAGLLFAAVHGPGEAMVLQTAHQ